MKISVCPKIFLPSVRDKSARRPYKSLKGWYTSRLSSLVWIASNVGKGKKKNKSFSKVLNVKSLLYITDIENKEIIEA